MGSINDHIRENVLPGESISINDRLIAHFSRQFLGDGSPEGTITAPVGSTYTRRDGGTGSTFYVKESGSGNTGWVAGGGSSNVSSTVQPSGDTTGVADTAAIQAALTALPSTGGIVELGNGIFYVNATLTMAKQNSMLRGTGFSETTAPTSGTIVKAVAGFVGTQVLNVTGTDCTVTDLQLDGAAIAATALTIDANAFACKVINCGLKRGTTTTVDFDGNRGWLINCRIVHTDVASGIALRMASTDGMIVSNRIVNGLTNVSAVAGNLQFVGNHFNNNGGTLGVNCESTNSQFVGNIFDNAGGPQLQIGSSSTIGDVVVVGNVFFQTANTDNTQPAILLLTTTSTVKRIQVTGNVMKGTSTNRYSYAISMGATPANVKGITFSNNNVLYAVALWDTRPTIANGNTLTIDASGNQSKPTEASGVSTQNGTGAQTVFNIAHGLAGAPRAAIVTPGSTAATGAYFVTFDATNVIVTFTVAPASGSSNVVLNWQAEM